MKVLEVLYMKKDFVIQWIVSRETETVTNKIITNLTSAAPLDNPTQQAMRY